MFEKTKINEKEPGVGPFFYKKLNITRKCWCWFAKKTGYRERRHESDIKTSNGKAKNDFDVDTLCVSVFVWVLVWLHLYGCEWESLFIKTLLIIY